MFHELDLQSTPTSHLMSQHLHLFIVNMERNNNIGDDDHSNNNNNMNKALSPEAVGGKMKPFQAAGDCIPR